MCGKYIYTSSFHTINVMVNTNNNHAIMKNRVGKNNHGINCEILKFLWEDLFILF